MSDKRTTDKELGALLDYFAERLTRIYAHHFCLFEFDENEDELDSSGMYDQDSPVKIIQNACLHASLIAIRDLDDFLSPRDSKSKSDDLKASNLTYSPKGNFDLKQAKNGFQ